MGKLVGLLGGVVGLAAEAVTHATHTNTGSRTSSAGDGYVNDSNRSVNSQWSTQPQYPNRIEDQQSYSSRHERDERYVSGPNPHTRQSYLQPPEQMRLSEGGRSPNEKSTNIERDYSAEKSWIDEDPPAYEEGLPPHPSSFQAPYRRPTAASLRQATYLSTSRNQSTHSGPLDLPIIIPQRRPENKSRGWAYVYAPSLAPCGINQEAFISFIIDFNKACQASPALDAVNLAAVGVGFAPGITPMIISMAVPVAVNAAKKAQTSTQASNFLAKANTELFAPRGLMAMMTTFNSNQSTQVISYGTGQNQGPSNGLASDSGEIVLPPSAPLMFFQRDEIAEPGNGSGSTMSRAGHFMGDYFDRRAQYNYAQEHAGYSGSDKGPQFTSRWSDPSNGGSLVGMLSGGHIQREQSAKRQDKQLRKQEEKANRRPGLIGSMAGVAMGPEAKNQGLIKGLKSKVASQELLYLMIVNVDDRSQSAW